MIKIEDLRIGNYIQDFECEPYIFKVEQISKHIGYGLWVFYGNGSIKVKDPEPIELTEEWLLKFNFNKDNYGLFELVKGGGKTFSGCTIELWAKECKPKEEWVWGICIGEDFGNLTHLAYIKYVHQLQNLYFALAGQELELK